MNPQQRINIQYTIDMEELPREVTKIYDKAVKQLRTVNLTKISEQEILNSGTVKMIEEARHNLAKVDIMLSDAQSIINSYVEYELSLSREQTNTDQQTQVSQHENAG